MKQRSTKSIMKQRLMKSIMGYKLRVTSYELRVRRKGGRVDRWTSGRVDNPLCSLWLKKLIMICGFLNLKS